MSDEKNDKVLDLIVSELKEISKEQKDQGKVQVTQQEILREHMRRTELNEKAIELHASDLKPIQKHVEQVNTVLMLLGSIGGLVAVVCGILEIIDFISKRH